MIWQTKPTRDFAEYAAIEACGPGYCMYSFHQREGEPNEAKNKEKEEICLIFQSQTWPI